MSQDYWTSMDRSSYISSTNDYFKDIPEPKVEANPEFSINDIGASRWIDAQNPDPVRAIQGDIRAGAGHIEITAPGGGRGDRNSPTFENFDKEQRAVIRDIQKAVDVSISTHATPNSWGLSGFNTQNNRFSEEKRAGDQNEIRKAIDFASEGTFGGSVVVHTGEFQRPMYNLPGHEGLFETHDEENLDSSYLIVDTENKTLVSSVQEDKEIYLPKKKKDKDGNVIYIKGENEDYIDPISKEKVPEYEFRENSNDIAFDRLTFNDFVQRQINENPDTIRKYLKDMGQDASNLDPNSVFVKEIVAKEFYHEQQQAQISQQLMGARQYLEYYTEGLRTRDKILEQLNFFKKLKKDLPEEEYKNYNKQKQYRDPTFAPDNIDPLQYYQEQLADNDRMLAMGRESNLSSQRQVLAEIERLKKAQTFREFSLEKSSKSYGELGIYAYDKTKSMEAGLKDSAHKDKIKPINIAMENIYPAQGYGSNVDELIDLVKRSRKQMKDMLVEKRGIEEKKAEKFAKTHIKATFDTGHFNIWRRYFKHKKGESEDDYDKRFKGWYLTQVEKLAKEGIIGNVHLADNYGYDDAHLAPGFGNTPIKDVMSILKKHGYKDHFAVEGGFNQGKIGFHEAWRHMGAPIYSSAASAWTDVGESFGNVYETHLGRMHRPYFVFGDYVPDKEGWKPWSGTTME